MSGNSSSSFFLSPWPPKKAVFSCPTPNTLLPWLFSPYPRGTDALFCPGFHVTGNYLLSSSKGQLVARWIDPPWPQLLMTEPEAQSFPGGHAQWSPRRGLLSSAQAHILLASLLKSSLILVHLLGSMRRVGC